MNRSVGIGIIILCSVVLGYVAYCRWDTLKGYFGLRSNQDSEQSAQGSPAAETPAPAPDATAPRPSGTPTGNPGNAGTPPTMRTPSPPKPKPAATAEPFKYKKETIYNVVRLPNGGDDRKRMEAIVVTIPGPVKLYSPVCDARWTATRQEINTEYGARYPIRAKHTTKKGAFDYEASRP